MRQRWERVICGRIDDLSMARLYHHTCIQRTHKNFIFCPKLKIENLIKKLSNMFYNLSSCQQCSPLSKGACLANGIYFTRFLESSLQRLTEMMKWLQRLRSAKSSPAPGFFTPTELNKSWEKYMSSAQKSFVFTAKASSSQPRSSVAAMKITRFGFLKSRLKKTRRTSGAFRCFRHSHSFSIFWVASLSIFYLYILMALR